ncbi:MAG: ribulose-phosphate 3-epimerase, partial [Nanoarchaeota archaeon]
MTIIVPAVLVRTRRQLRERLTLKASRFHIDIMDGKFVRQRTIGAATLRSVRTRAFIEAHLMIKDPLRRIREFVGIADLVVPHAEAIDDLEDYAHHARELGFKVGIAINPRTPLRAVLAHASLFDYVLIMAVRPGKGGQRFDPRVLSKVALLRKRHPRLSIGVDGGVHHDTVGRIVAA